MKRILAALLLAGVVGCTTPATFDQRMFVGYHSVAETRTQAANLLDLRKIGSADAENVQKQADLGREGLDIAKSLHPTSPQAAEQKLSATQAIIAALKAYLLSKEQK